MLRVLVLPTRTCVLHFTLRLLLRVSVPPTTGAVQQGWPVLPKSSRKPPLLSLPSGLRSSLLKTPARSLPAGPERIAANAELFHFEIAQQDMARLANMDRGLALAWGAGDPCLTP